MKWFRDLPIGRKLALSFSLCLFLSLLQGAISIREMSSLNEDTDRLAQGPLAMTALVAQLAGDMRHFRLLEYNHLLETDRNAMAASEADMRARRERIESALAGYEKHVTEPEDRTNIDSLEDAWNAYTAQADQQMTLGRSENTKAAFALMKSRRERYNAVADRLHTIGQWNEARGKKLEKQATATFHEGRALAIGILAVAIALGALAAAVVTRLVTGPLALLSRSASSLALGDVEQEIEIETKDEIGALARNFRDMIRYQKEMADAATTMATGDFRVEVKPQSERDTLGNSFQQMQASLKEMASAAAVMASGDFGVDIRPQGERDMLGNAFQRMQASLREMADAATTMATGDFSVEVKPQGERDTLGVAFQRMQASLKAMAAAAATMAAGDFSVPIRPQSERDALGNAFKHMQASLSELLAQTRTASDAIAIASEQVAAGNQDLSQRTEEQAASLEETASSMEEMTSTVKQNADNARQANQLAAQAREVAEKGGQVVSDAVSAMAQISQGSKKVADIVTVIDEIAFQTNLLALNAAVEAARVGEQGRGFAVVAGEVRALAARSASAAREIKALVSDTVARVEHGTECVNTSGERLTDIVLSVKKVSDIVAEISAASMEQSAGIEQVNKAVLQMDQVTQQNAALVEESATAAAAMKDQAVDLRALVGRFTIDEAYLTRTKASAVRPEALREGTTGSTVGASAAVPRPQPKLQVVSGSIFTAQDDFQEF